MTVAWTCSNVIDWPKLLTNMGCQLKKLQAGTSTVMNNALDEAPNLSGSSWKKGLHNQCKQTS